MSWSRLLQPGSSSKVPHVRSVSTQDSTHKFLKIAHHTCPRLRFAQEAGELSRKDKANHVAQKVYPGAICWRPSCLLTECPFFRRVSEHRERVLDLGRAGNEKHTRYRHEHLAQNSITDSLGWRTNNVLGLQWRHLGAVDKFERKCRAKKYRVRARLNGLTALLKFD